MISLLGLNLKEKLISKASPAQINPVPIDKVNVLIEFLKNFSLKNAIFTSKAHRLNSKIGNIKPIKIGSRQIEKAKKALKPLKTSSLLGEKVELLDV